MVATLVVISYHGAAAGTETDITSATIKYRRSDVDTNNASNPIPKPAAGTNYSWRKSMKLKCTVTPDGDLSNLRWFSDGVSPFSTGCTIYARTNGTYTQGASGDESAQVAGTADASTYTSASPLAVNAGTVLSNPSTGTGTQDYVVSQFAAGTTAVRGTNGPRTYTYRVDET